MFKLELDFDDGNGWIDVPLKSEKFQRTLNLHSSLKSTVNKCNVIIDEDDATFINKLLVNKHQYGKDIAARITHAADGIAFEDWFHGYIKSTLKTSTTSIRNKPVPITILDPGIKLQKKIGIAPYVYINMKVCDPSNTSNSIIHQLMYEAGFTVDAVKTTTVIDKTIPYFIIDKDAEYHTLMGDLLYEFAHVYYFDVDGKLDILDIAPTDVSTTNRFDNTNLYNNIEREVRKFDDEAIQITWYEQKSLSNGVIFSDTSGGDDDTKAKIVLSPGEYYPENGDQYDWFSDYQLEDREFIVALNPTLSVVKDAEISVEAEELGPLRARVLFKNNAASDKTIYKFDITADPAVYKGPLTISLTENIVNTTKRQEYEAQYINTQADAQKLGSSVCLWLKHSQLVYSVESTADYKPNDYVRYYDNKVTLGDQYTRVISRIDNIKSGINNKEVIKTYYKAEALTDYVALTTTQKGNTNTSPPAAYVPSELPGVSDVVTYEDDQNGYTDATTGATVIPDIPVIIRHESLSKNAIELLADNQPLLTNLSHYEWLVSDDQTSWYALRFDLVDWKGNEFDNPSSTNYTSDLDNHLIHPVSPAGTQDNPEGRTLYYKVRRVTKADLRSDWSDVVAATTKLIEDGDIAANTISANKVVTDFINAAIAKITDNIQITTGGFTGTIAGQDVEPTEGDFRARLDANEVTHEQYQDGTWVMYNKMGGDAGSEPFPYFQTYGIAKTGATDELNSLDWGKVVPSGSYIYNFEGDWSDQDGLNEIDIQSNVILSDDANARGTYGSKANVFYSYQDMGLTGVTLEGTTSLSASTTYSFGMSIDGGTNTTYEITTTTDLSYTTLLYNLNLLTELVDFSIVSGDIRASRTDLGNEYSVELDDTTGTPNLLDTLGVTLETPVSSTDTGYIIKNEVPSLRLDNEFGFSAWMNHSGDDLGLKEIYTVDCLDGSSVYGTTMRFYKPESTQGYQILNIDGIASSGSRSPYVGGFPYTFKHGVNGSPVDEYTITPTIATNKTTQEKAELRFNVSGVALDQCSNWWWMKLYTADGGRYYIHFKIGSYPQPDPAIAEPQRFQGYTKITYTNTNASKQSVVPGFINFINNNYSSLWTLYAIPEYTYWDYESGYRSWITRFQITYTLPGPVPPPLSEGIYGTDQCLEDYLFDTIVTSSDTYPMAHGYTGATEYNTWSEIITLMNAEISNSVFTIDSGNIKCTSDAYGSSSSISLKDGITGRTITDDIASWYIDSPVIGISDTGNDEEDIIGFGTGGDITIPCTSGSTALEVANSLANTLQTERGYLTARESSSTTVTVSCELEGDTADWVDIDSGCTITKVQDGNIASFTDIFTLANGGGFDVGDYTVNDGTNEIRLGGGGGGIWSLSNGKYIGIGAYSNNLYYAFGTVDTTNKQIIWGTVYVATGAAADLSNYDEFSIYQSEDNKFVFGGMYSSNTIYLTVIEFDLTTEGTYNIGTRLQEQTYEYDANNDWDGYWPYYDWDPVLIGWKSYLEIKGETTLQKLTDNKFIFVYQKDYYDNSDVSIFSNVFTVSGLSVSVGQYQEIDSDSFDNYYDYSSVTTVEGKCMAYFPYYYSSTPSWSARCAFFGDYDSVSGDVVWSAKKELLSPWGVNTRPGCQLIDTDLFMLTYNITTGDENTQYVLGSLDASNDITLGSINEFLPSIEKTHTILTSNSNYLDRNWVVKPSGDSITGFVWYDGYVYGNTSYGRQNWYIESFRSWSINKTSLTITLDDNVSMKDYMYQYPVSGGSNYPIDFYHLDINEAGNAAFIYRGTRTDTAAYEYVTNFGASLGSTLNIQLGNNQIRWYLNNSEIEEMSESFPINTGWNHILFNYNESESEFQMVVNDQGVTTDVSSMNIFEDATCSFRIDYAANPYFIKIDELLISPDSIIEDWRVEDYIISNEGWSGYLDIDRDMAIIPKTNGSVYIGGNLISAVADQRWREVGTSGNPAFENDWDNTAGVYAPARFRKDAEGWVHLSGRIDSGTDSTIFTLPTGYRPDYTLTMQPGTSSTTTTPRINITTAGSVKVINLGNATWISLDNIRFYPD